MCNEIEFSKTLNSLFFLHEAISKIEFNVKNFENVSSNFLEIFLKFRSLKD